MIKILNKRPFKNKCMSCGCKFTFDEDDISISKTIPYLSHAVVICPICKSEILVRFMR